MAFFFVAAFACSPPVDATSIGTATSSGSGAPTSTAGASQGEAGATSTGTASVGGNGASSGTSGASSAVGAAPGAAGSESPGAAGEGTAGSGSGAAGGAPNTAGATNAAGTTSAAGSASTSACPELEGRPPLPVVGPWLFGPDPGPCEYRNGESNVEYEHITFSYYDDGRPERGVYENGYTNEFVYDDSNRVIQFGTESAPWGVTYDGTRVASVESETSRVTFQYDDGGRIVYVDYAYGDQVQVERTYTWEDCRIVRREEDGRIEESVPDGSVDANFDYTYDEDGRLISILEREGNEAFDLFDYSCW